jgi:hypothetical protein
MLALTPENRFAFLVAGTDTLMAEVGLPGPEIELIDEDHPSYERGEACVHFPEFRLLEPVISAATVERYGHEVWHFGQDVDMVDLARFRHPQASRPRIARIYSGYTNLHLDARIVRKVLALPPRVLSKRDCRRAAKLCRLARRDTPSGRQLQLLDDLRFYCEYFNAPARQLGLVRGLVGHRRFLFGDQVALPEELAAFLDWAGTRPAEDQVLARAEAALPPFFPLIEEVARTLYLEIGPTELQEKEATAFGRKVARLYQEAVRSP